jgi:outer membrane protein TolC
MTGGMPVHEINDRTLALADDVLGQIDEMVSALEAERDQVARIRDHLARLLGGPPPARASAKAAAASSPRRNRPPR